MSSFIRVFNWKASISAPDLKEVKADDMNLSIKVYSTVAMFDRHQVEKLSFLSF